MRPPSTKAYIPVNCKSLTYFRVPSLITRYQDMSWDMKVTQNALFICNMLILVLAMKKMAVSNALIVGAQGLGVEIGRVSSSLLIIE